MEKSQQPRSPWNMKKLVVGDKRKNLGGGGKLYIMGSFGYVGNIL